MVNLPTWNIYIRIWGCKCYVRSPRSDIRKDWTDSTKVGFLVGYSKTPIEWVVYISEGHNTSALAHAWADSSVVNPEHDLLSRITPPSRLTRTVSSAALAELMDVEHENQIVVLATNHPIEDRECDGFPTVYTDNQSPTQSQACITQASDTGGGIISTEDCNIGGGAQPMDIFTERDIVYTLEGHTLSISRRDIADLMDTSVEIGEEPTRWLKSALQIRIGYDTTTPSKNGKQRQVMTFVGYTAGNGFLWHLIQQGDTLTPSDVEEGAMVVYQAGAA
jgi:hypothetical protein